MVIDLEMTIYELCTADPSFTEVMVELGFVDITKPAMLKTVGRMMTLTKGARMKGMSLEDIKTKLIHKGYEIIEEKGGQINE